MAGFGSEYSSEDQSQIKRASWPSRFRSPIVLDFESDADAVNYADTADSPWKGLKRSRSKYPKLGTQTWTEAVHLARGGWADGIKLLSEYVDAIIHPVTTLTESYIYDVAGHMPDIPRYLSGELENMFDARPERRALKPIVRIAVSPITQGEVDAIKIAYWGAALVSWIDELESHRFRVELNWVSCSKPFWVTEEDRKNDLAGPRIVIKFPLKQTDQPVDLERLAFWIMHSAAQRRIQFAIKERLDVEKWYGEWYGIPEDNIHEIKRYLAPGSSVFTVGFGASTIEEGIVKLRTMAENYMEN